MKNFDDFGLAPNLLRAIAEMGFETPTPVQDKVIPVLLQGDRDLVALAQTGTGKTAAFGLPLMHLVDPARAVPQGLILCPTRELCLQITGDLADFGKYLPGIRVLAVYGGTPIEAQIRALRRGVHIVVATPGRMHDLLRRRCVRVEDVEHVVLDEADEMLNMGFQEDLEAILKDVPESARSLLFSATMPRQVAAIAGNYMHDPEEIVIGTRNAVSDHVRHEFYTVHARDRYPALKRIIDSHPDLYGIVFCRTRVETQDVASRLIDDGYNADTLHGDLSQGQRDRVMERFRGRHLQVLVATDVAARGLDVENLTHVIHYNLPEDPGHYTHRSGRTGRAGKEGVSAAIVHMREEYKIRAIERLLRTKFHRRPVPTGEEVCEARLLDVMERMARIDISENKIDPFMPAINDLLGKMTREEIVKRFVLREFNRFLDYYKNAPDLNVPERHAPRERPARPDNAARNAPRRGPSDAVRLQVNIGLRNELTPSALIALINRATPGPMVRIGRIQIMEQASVFEILPEDAEALLPNLDGARFNGRVVMAKPVDRPVGGKRFPDSRGPRPGGHRPDTRPRGKAKKGRGYPRTP